MHTPQRAADLCQTNVTKTRHSSLQYSSQKGLLTASSWSVDAFAKLLLSSSENSIGLALAFLSQSNSQDSKSLMQVNADASCTCTCVHFRIVTSLQHHETNLSLKASLHRIVVLLARQILQSGLWIICARLCRHWPATPALVCICNLCHAVEVCKPTASDGRLTAGNKHMQPHNEESSKIPEQHAKGTPVCATRA